MEIRPSDSINTRQTSHHNNSVSNLCHSSHPKEVGKWLTLPLFPLPTRQSPKGQGQSWKDQEDLNFAEAPEESWHLHQSSSPAVLALVMGSLGPTSQPARCFSNEHWVGGQWESVAKNSAFTTTTSCISHHGACVRRILRLNQILSIWVDICLVFQRLVLQCVKEVEVVLPRCMDLSWPSQPNKT